MNIKFIIICACLFSFILNASIQDFHFKKNHRELNGYLSTSASNSFPILIALQDSQKQSVLEFHRQVEDFVQDLNIGVMTIEKLGVTREKIDDVLYDQTQHFTQRLDDYLLLYDYLNENVEGWNGQVILLGVEEGGKLAGVLAARLPNVLATLLFSTGGGMNSADEIKWSTTESLLDHNVSQEQIAEHMQAIDAQFEEMRKSPTTEKYFKRQTYFWWVGHLDEHEYFKEMLSVDTPILMIQGKKDRRIPVKSAEFLLFHFYHANKDNLTFSLLEDYTGEWNRPFNHAEESSREWLKTILFAN